MQRLPRFARLGRTAAAGIAGMAMVASAAGQAQAAEGLGYTDLRLTFGTMPMDGFSGGPGWNKQSGDYDSGFRVGVLAIGPICGILPIGCATPPRLSNSDGSSSSNDVYGGYDDLALEEDFVYYDSGATYDLLLGFELSGISLASDGEVNPLASIYGDLFADPLQYQLLGSSLTAGINPNLYFSYGLGEPEVEMTAYALTVHFGWGFEVATRTSGRWHWEITPFVGAGLATVDWTDGLTGETDDGEGLYVEAGARIGTYYTFPIGLQIGASVRGIYADADVDVFNGSPNLSVAGISFGGEVGWRF